MDQEADKDQPNEIEVTISGPPKVGKTTLALAIARMLGEHGIKGTIHDDAGYYLTRWDVDAALKAMANKKVRVVVRTQPTLRRTNQTVHGFRLIPSRY